MKNSNLQFFCLGTLIFLAVSCKTIKPPTQEVHHNNEIEIKTRIEPSNAPYNASKTRKFDLLHTKLEVSFDWEKQYLNGVASLKLTPYFYTQEFIEIDAKGMDIHKVELLSPKQLPLKYTYDNMILKIVLDKKYTKLDTFDLGITYTAKPNELPKGGSAAITEDKGLYFINPDGSDKNKPRQIWTQGETEASSAWFPTIDATNERCTQEMYITVDTIFSVLSNGEKFYSKNNSNGTKTEYWKMELPHAPYLFMMAVGEFAIVNDSMPTTGKYDWKDLEIQYYVEPAYEKYAKDIFGHTPEMIEFFSSLLNYKYPWNKYSQVVVRDYVSGAMENTTAVVFMEAVQMDDRELLDEHWDGIIAHELFHHWFGDLVTTESWANLPLNESFANYSEYLWAEHKFGVDEADLLAEKEESEYLDEAKRKQEPLIRYHYKDREDMFDRHSYNKGGRVLHMLRKYVGDEAFFTSLNLYLKENEFGPVEIHHLRMAFEKITGEDLNWFFNQWFLSPGHAEVKVDHIFESGILKLKFSQLQDSTLTPIYKLPIPVDVWVNGNKSRHIVTIDKANEEVIIPLQGSPQLVLVDPENILLGNLTHNKKRPEYIYQYKNSDRYIPRILALKNLFVNEKGDVKSKENPKFSDPEIRDLLLSSLKDPFWNIRDFGLDQFSTYLIPDFEYFLPVIENIAQSDSKPSVRAKAIYLLSSYNNNKYISIYEKGINEKAYSVVGAALTGYLSAKVPGAEQKLNEYLDVDNINIILPLANYFLEIKDTGRYSWFKEKMATGSPQKLYNMLMFFGPYLKLVTVAEKEDGINILKQIAKENKYDVIRDMAAGYLEILK